MGNRVFGGVFAVAACFVVGVGSANAATANFNNPGGYAFTVPAGVTSITVTAIGGAGGDCFGAGGEGASVSATVPVSPGEQLFVGVGADGAGGCGSSGGGAGGGGAGGAGNNIYHPGGGGGASVIALGPPSAAFNDELVVAGGGGGAGVGGASGGNAGAAGANGTAPAAGGGPGTQNGGGTGGTAGSGGATAGSQGVFGLGGSGGNGDSGGTSAGGGGGGGGYYGGGGGGGSAITSGSAGGGGGSSFVVSDATGVTGPTPSGAAPMVSITYGVPTAEQSTTSMSFGTQPQGTAGPEQDLTVTNNGSATLIVAGVVLSGANPGDYLIDNHQCLGGVAPGSSCVIGVRFDPQAAGASSATMTVITNAPTAPGAVSLSGTGGALPQGPPGATGATGATGPQGPAGKIELVTCRTVVHHHHRRRFSMTCKGRLVSGTVKFTATGKIVHATVSRGGVVYASGESVPAAGGGSMLVLSDRRRLRRGGYTLTLRRRHGTHRERITIG